MPEHSKGPWEIVAYGIPQLYEIDNGESCIAQGVLMEPDARLIAAAPELLDTLDLLLCLISVNGDDVGIISDTHTIRTIHKARAAVAKATGEAIP